MRNRTIRLSQRCPSPTRPYALVPVGTYLNRRLRSASPGDTVVFDEQWRYVRSRFVRGCMVKTDSAVFTFLMRSLLDPGLTWSLLLEHWRHESVLAGYGRNGVDETQCLLIEVETE